MNEPTHVQGGGGGGGGGAGGGGGGSAGSGQEDRMSGLFAGMVMQQTNLALMLLGATPHPETGKILHDLEGARMFIDQLEMLQNKTRGNLSAPEEKLLQQSLMTLRLAFVEAVDHPQGAAETGSAPKTGAGTSPAPSSPAGSHSPPPAPASDDEARKKFSKKY